MANFLDAKISLQFFDLTSCVICNYQRISALAQRKPLPKAARATRSPSFIFPSCQASQRAMGIDAAVVLPYLSMFEITFSSGRFISFCTAWVMRALAW